MVMEDSRQPRNQAAAAASVETGYPGGVMNSGLTVAAANSSSKTAAMPPSLRVREATPSKDDLEDDLLEDDNIIDEDDDDDEAEADDESSSVSVPTTRSSVRFSPSSSSNIIRPSRERRHSTVTNPYPMLAPHPGAMGAAPPSGQTESVMASAIPSHLDLTISGEQSIKRRSKSTVGPLSVSPPTKAPRSGELEDLPLRPYHYLQHYHHGHHHHNRPYDSSSSPQPNFYAKPPLSGLSYSPRDGAAARHHSVSGAHHRPSPSAVRFRGDDYGGGRVGGGGVDSVSGGLLRYPYSNLIAPPAGSGSVPASAAGSGSGAGGVGGGGRVYRQCPHKIAEENHDPAKWEKNGGKEEEGSGGAAGVADGQQGQHQQQQALVVQRTHSNPEMECCPLCMARNQCEILVRRTYSKVAATSVVGLLFRVVRIDHSLYCVHSTFISH